MDVTPLIPKGSQIIEAYGDGGFRVTGQRYEGALLIFTQRTQIWALTDWTQVTPEDFSAVFDESPLPEIVVIGCGEHFGMVPKALKREFSRRGIAVEAMDTGAACRTYNVLLSEGRRVVAALLAV